jgi:5-methylcytosine-specific restriction endonuclease McrA
MIKPSRKKNSPEVKALKAKIAAIKGTRERKSKQDNDPFAYRPGMGSEFYKTREWRELRWQVLKEEKPECAKCGSTKKPFHVDHIRPRSKFPHLELKRENMQVLCEDCNIGKSDSI